MTLDDREVIRKIGSDIWGPFPLTYSYIWDQKRENSGLDFGQLSNFTAHNFGMEQDIVNRKSALKAADTPLGGSLILLLWVNNKKVPDCILTHHINFFIRPNVSGFAPSTFSQFRSTLSCELPQE